MVRPQSASPLASSSAACTATLALEPAACALYDHASLWKGAVVGVMTHAGRALGFFRTLFQTVYFLPDVDWLLKWVDEVHSERLMQFVCSTIAVCVCACYRAPSATRPRSLGPVVWRSPLVASYYRRPTALLEPGTPPKWHRTGRRTFSRLKCLCHQISFSRSNFDRESSHSQKEQHSFLCFIGQR